MKRDIAMYAVRGVLILVAVGYVFYDSMIPVLLLSPYVVFHVKSSIRERALKEERQLANAFKDGIVAVSFSLNVGYSIENAFREAAREMKLLHGEDSRIVSEFSYICNRLAQNDNIEDVLDDFADRSGVDDIAYFAEVFRFAKRSGGDLIAIARSTAAVINDKNEVEGEIETIISGKRMEQRVMNVIPFGIVLYLRLTSPEFVAPLYGNLIGIVAMTACLCVYVAALCIGKRIVDIRV
jgi:tight adherence protein B